ncbi:hypothetical protein BY458DRAFT_561025 [Sporodiniella umbellata]|nr:hypothetical protein BY458DRAFT_561025 [Sporodiniella umbellata]
MHTTQTPKRKHELTKENTNKRLQTPSRQDYSMREETCLPTRPKTPPLGMTLAHYNPNTGSYVSSQLNSDQEIKSSICTGMTPIYQSPIERWGSTIL